MGVGVLFRPRLMQLAYNGIARRRWQHPNQVVDALDITGDDTVLDVGAGGGYFTFRMAKTAKRVYAIDVDRRMVMLLQRDARRLGHQNVYVILADDGDPKISRPLDLVVVVNTYHHLPDPGRYFARLRSRLGKDGRVAIIEPHKRSIFGFLGHGTAPTVIKAEMRQAGYRLLEQHDFLRQQSFLVFRPRSQDKPLPN